MENYDSNTVFVKGDDGKFHIDDEKTKAAQATSKMLAERGATIPRACVGGLNTAMNYADKAANRAKVKLSACALIFREDLGKYIFVAEGTNKKGVAMNIPIVVDVA